MLMLRSTHQAEVTRLGLEISDLRRQLAEAQRECGEKSGKLAGVEAQRDDLLAQRSRLEDTVDDMAAQLGSARRAPAAETPAPEQRSLTGEEVVKRAEQYRARRKKG